jgi:hypothetical protein
MKKYASALAIVVLVLAVLSCSLINRFTSVGVDNLTRTNELWPDVPKMDGLDHSEMEMPLPVKLLMRTMLNNMYKLNKNGEDKTPVSGDWVVFSTTKSPQDVQAFYTNDRMTSFGNWETSKQQTCYDGTDKGYPGVLCGFKKVENGKEYELLILAGKEDKKNVTDVFYLRLESDADANSNSSKR